MQIQILIPPAIKPGKKCDIRNWLNHLRGQGKSPDEIAGLMRSQCRPVTREQAVEKAIEETDEILAEVGIEVIGVLDKNRIKIFGIDTGRYTEIPNIAHWRFANFLQAAGPRFSAKVVDGEKSKTGSYPLEAIRSRIAESASKAPKLKDDSERGAGIWDSSGDVVCVTEGYLSVWNGTGELRKSTRPRIGKQLYDIAGNPEWFDHNQLSQRLANATPDADRAAVRAAIEIFARWRWEFQHAAELVTGAILATWIQKLWKWRPQMIFIGETGTGKTILMETVRHFFCGLAHDYSWSATTTPKGIIRYCQASGYAMVLDEFDRNRYQKEIFEECIRPAGRGLDARLTGEASKGKIIPPLRQMFWVGGIHSSIDTKTDADRVIRLEMLPRAPGARQIVQPGEQECREIGQGLLTAAVRHARAARELAIALGAVEYPTVSNRVTETYSVPAAMLALSLGESGGDWLERLLSNSFSLTREVVADQEDLIDTVLGSHVDAGRELGRLSVRQLMQILIDPHGNPTETELSRRALEKVGIYFQDEDSSVLLHASDISRHLLQKTKFRRTTVGEYFQRVPLAKRYRRRIGENRQNKNFWRLPLESFLDEFQPEKEENDGF